MKKTLLLATTILVLFFSSCSSDDENNAGILVKKIVSEGSEFVYSYNGNKILKATIFGQHVDYSYSGDLITSVKRFDSFNSITFETNYTYENNNLVQEITFDYVDGVIIKVEYTYNINNIISFVRYQNDSGSFVEVNHGNYYLNNENEVQEYELFTNSNDLINRFEFTFDNHNNPFKNVVGFSKIFSSTSENGFYRNIISRKVFDENNILVQSYENEYSYNQNEYPETRTTFFNGSTSIETTSQFYY